MYPSTKSPRWTDIGGRLGAVNHAVAGQLSCRAYPYVNGTTGSDVLDEGRGESADKPFATLQAAINYVAANYNLNTYDATILVASGYNSDTSIELPKYSTVTGQLIIRGSNPEDLSEVIIGNLLLGEASNYLLWDLTIKGKNSNSFSPIVWISNGQLELRNVLIDISQTIAEGSLYGLYAEKSGVIRIYAVNNLSTKCGCRIKISEITSGSSITLIGASGGQIQFSADVTIEGTCILTQTISASNLGVVNRTKSVFVNPGRSPIFTATGTITGRRYTVSTNSIISVMGGGDEFFPGSIQGVTVTGGQYV